MKNSIWFFGLLLLVSCNNKKADYQEVKTTEDSVSMVQFEPSEAKELMEKHCYLCHSPSAAEQEGRIAPPMVAIKGRYITMQNYTKAEFIKAVTDFVAEPTTEKALMNGAVKRFGVMPKQAFPEGSVAKIAEFMYDYQIEEPDWFAEHWKGNHGEFNWKQSGKQFQEEAKEKTYADIGLEYALGTKKVLGKNLMGTIQKEGTEAALKFCNVSAMSLTDSMSVHYNAEIKRVSDKNRNPNNKANAEELGYIEQFKKDLSAQKEIQPIVVEETEKVHFYYPIETNTMCLQCHGNPENIKPEVLKKLKTLYPNDLATGYAENEVRGIWSITFDKK